MGGHNCLFEKKIATFRKLIVSWKIVCIAADLLYFFVIIIWGKKDFACQGQKAFLYLFRIGGLCRKEYYLVLDRK